jgi:arylsulfatase A
MIKLSSRSTIMRRILLLCVVAGLLPGSVRAQEKKQPNFIVILADDLGWGDLGCYGHPVIKTPNLDKLASEGMRFTQCYSASAVCSPSRSAILTGRTPYRNGVFTWIPQDSQLHLRPTEITIATLLRRIGYTTCHVGKWHLNGMFNSPKQPQPNDHGFDWWLATQNNAGPNHKNPTNFVRNGKWLGKQEGFSSHIVVNEAIDWLKNERDKAKPFCMSVWFHEPHAIIETDPKYQALYPDLVKSDPDKAQHHGNISQMDAAVGMLLKALEELNLGENTFIIFTSDNGPEGDGVSGRNRGSTGGLRGRKRSVYEGGIRVAGIMRWPGKIRPGSTCDEPIIGSDIFTSLCAVSGIKTPQDRPIDGVNFLPAFEGKNIERKTPMYFRCNIAPEPLKISMRVGNWSIHADEKLTKFELYNLKNDIKQTTDLAAKESAKFEEMRERLIRLNTEIEKEGPTWWQGYVEAKKKKKG